MPDIIDTVKATMAAGTTFTPTPLTEQPTPTAPFFLVKGPHGDNRIAPTKADIEPTVAAVMADNPAARKVDIMVVGPLPPAWITDRKASVNPKAH